MKIDPLAGTLANAHQLIDVPALLAAYYALVPDPAIVAQRVSFGTSGHRGSSLDQSFNELHILAISQAICLYRLQNGITGPLFIGIDTHALSKPALISCVEVLAAHQVQVRLAKEDDYTPTPVISHAILTYNKGRKQELADGIVITPSHNPPAQGGFKYNPPHGGPAELAITQWIENKANELLAQGLKAFKRLPYEKALATDHVRYYDFRTAYIEDLSQVIDLQVIRDSNIKIGVDPLGGAGVHYWQPLAERYKLNLTLVNYVVDPTFRFMALDWDGQIRMDPSSPYAMKSLIALKDQFDLSFACDTDHDRHGIVTKSFGLMPPNHYFCAAIAYLFKQRPLWLKQKGNKASIGKTVVSSSLIDRVVMDLGLKLYEVPVGFKWFVQGLLEGTLNFVCEESAGASFSRLDGSVWTTDKDGIILSLLAAEMLAKEDKDPAELYQIITETLGNPVYDRVEAVATAAQKKSLAHLSANQVTTEQLAGQKISSILTAAPGNQAAIGGLKVVTEAGWFAARPSGTEDIYKIYGESFQGQAHLDQILKEAQTLVNKALKES